jgi:hypothetical protein
MNNLLNLIEQMFNNLKGRVYNTLSLDHKMVVYAYELWNDSMDIKEAEELMFDQTLTESFIDDQLKNTFEYSESTVIGGNK